MTFISKRIFLSLFIFFSVLGVAGYALTQSRIERTDVRLLTQDWASQILKAQVQIGKLVYLPPTRIAFKDIQVNADEKNREFSVASVRKLILGYGVINLVRGNFRVPEMVKIQSPVIHIPASNSSPLPFLNTGASSNAFPAKLIIEDGEFHYPLKEGKEIVLSRVYLKAKPTAAGQIQVKLKALLKGEAYGQIEVNGFTDPQFHHYELHVHLEDLGFSPESGIFIKKLSGDFRITEKTIELTGLTSFFHDWEIFWKGTVENWNTEPQISVEVTQKKGKPPFLFSFNANLASQKMTGRGTWAGRNYSFLGAIKREGKKIIFSSLDLSRGYQGKGEIQFATGDYDFQFERQQRRFRLRSNLNESQFDAEFELDHASINNLDFVVLGNARFSPMLKKKGETGPKFKVEIETQYVVVEFQSLQDFKGSFELNTEGIKEMDLEWGGAFRLSGQVLFRGTEIKEDLLLQIDGYSLESLRKFAGRPMPQNLRGTLEGKLKLRGAPSRPEIQGYFTVKDGMIEKLDYDRAIIEFRGFPPQLRLYDSKVFRGRNTLMMTGVIDLRLDNFFHGIRIQRSDHLVIWKGMSVYWEGDHSTIQGEKSLNKKLAMGFEVGAGVSPNSKSEDGEESYALLGPKLKF